MIPFAQWLAETAALSAVAASVTAVVLFGFSFFGRALAAHLSAKALEDVRSRSAQAIADLQIESARDLETLRERREESLAKMQREHQEQRDEMRAAHEHSMVRFTRLSQQQAEAIHELHDGVERTISATEALARALKDQPMRFFTPPSEEEAGALAALEQGFESALNSLAETYRRRRLFFDKRFDVLMQQLAVAATSGIAVFKDKAKDYQFSALGQFLHVMAAATADSGGTQSEQGTDSPPWVGKVPEVDLEAAYATVIERLQALSNELVDYFRATLGVVAE